MLIPRYTPITQKRLQQLINDRAKADYRLWKEAVIYRDGRRCQWPGCNDNKKIEVHHIISFANNQSLRTDVNNGICLCKKHHDGIKDQEDHYVKLFLQIAKANGIANPPKTNNKDNSGHKGTETTSVRKLQDKDSTGQA